MTGLAVFLVLCACGSGAHASYWDDMLQEVKQVGGMQDPVIRNFRISWSYYEMGHAFQKELGTAGSTFETYELVWPSLAAWASNSVGISIRREIPPHFLDQVLRLFPPALRAVLKVVGPKVARGLFGKMLTKASTSLAGGNRDVYISVGTAFSQWGIYYAGLSAPDPAVNAAYNKTVFPTQSHLDRTLKEAMQFYYRAKFANTTRLRAQYIFAGNGLVGFGEQAYLQTAIEGSFPGNISIPFLGRTYRFNPAPIITRYLIALVFSNEVLEADNDVPVRPWDKQQFPERLRVLTPEIQAVYKQFSNSTDLKGTAARNWNVLADRMGFVVPLFRSRQDDIYLYQCPPFSSYQLGLIMAGQRPSESSLCLSGNCCS